MLYRSLADEPLLDVLRLIRTPHIGVVTFHQLMLRYGSVREALNALPSLTRKKPLVPCDIENAQREIENVERFGARFIRYGEDDYPKLLTHTHDAPPLLCLKGRAEVYTQSPLLAIVGSRHASANNCQFAQKIAREVGASGITIVSGLARGIDSFAHQGSLATGTVAVIAGGIDNIYPPENAKLYQAIAESGAIFSEQAFGQEPFAGAFPGRNRIIAGMSHATLVAEASLKSGSLITARLALEYQRELLAVPGSPLDPRAKGCNQLIKQGAHLVEESADAIQLVQSSTLHLRLSEPTPLEFSAEPLPEATHDMLLSKLSHSAIAVDELTQQCGLPAHMVQAALLEMELDGRVQRSLGGKVALSYTDVG